MKKLATIILSLSLMFVIVFSTKPTSPAATFAADTEASANLTDFITEEYKNFMINEEKLVHINRTAGTSGEQSAANYIAERLASFGLEPVISAGGISTFEFVSLINQQTLISQNVSFRLKGSESNKKVIITCAIDNIFGFYETEEEALTKIGEDAGVNKIIATLALAWHFSQEDQLPFDIEFIFFGASEHDRSGSHFFALGLNDKEKESILLTINIDDLSEKEIYFYDEEYLSGWGSFFNKATGISKYSPKTTIYFLPTPVYPFLHEGLASDSITFLNNRIPVVNVHSVPKTSFLGDVEETTKGIFTTGGFIQKANDAEPSSIRLVNIPKALNAAASVAEKIAVMLKRADFLDTLSKASSNKHNYAFFTNGLIAIMFTTVAVAALWVIYSFIFAKYLKQMKQHFNKKQSLAEVMTELDKRIDESNNPQLKAHKNEIKQLFGDRIKNDLEGKSKKETNDED